MAICAHKITQDTTGHRTLYDVLMNGKVVNLEEYKKAMSLDEYILRIRYVLFSMDCTLVGLRS